MTDGSGNLIVSYTYDADGRLSVKDLGNGTYTDYTYDDDSNLIDEVNYAPGGTINSSFAYTYDALGRVLTETTLDGEWTYTYDAIGELTHAVFASSNSSVPSEDLAYTYDADGNLLRTVENGVTTNYIVNSMNQYTAIGTETLTYDQDGNLVSTDNSGSVTNYSYDQLGNLLSVSGAGLSESFQYDALGNLSASTINGSLTEYLVDPTGLSGITGAFDSSGNVIAHYTYGLGLTSLVNAAGQADSYDFNLQGSTVGLSGSSGSYVNQYDYLPSGQLQSSIQSIENPFTYVGEFGLMTDASGLTSMTNRTYDSQIGRFLTPDPLNVNGGDTDLYSYANDDPVNEVDPQGTNPLILAGALDRGRNKRRWVPHRQPHHGPANHTRGRGGIGHIRRNHGRRDRSHGRSQPLGRGRSQCRSQCGRWSHRACDRRRPGQERLGHRRGCHFISNSHRTCGGQAAQELGLGQLGQERLAENASGSQQAWAGVVEEVV